MRKYLLIDMSNMLYRAFYANKNEDDDTLLSMCHHSAFISMNYLFKKYKPDEIVAVFDSHSWRKEYTKNSISHKPYKGNRRNNLTKVEQERLAIFDNHIKEFYEFLKAYTSILVLKRDLLECDDIVAGFVDLFDTDEHIIISSDQDFIQLLNHKNVKLIEPDKEKERSLSEWNMDHEFFMFEKCIRGDSGDNVQSSYPKIRKTKIDEAYVDPFIRQNIMEHEFEVEYYDQEGLLSTKKYKTRELFEENILLMDLRKQPDYIKKIIKKCIVNGFKDRSTFNLKEFLKFCNKHGLQRILENPASVTKMLNTNSFKNSSYFDG